MKKITGYALIILLVSAAALSGASARIISLRGRVSVRPYAGARWVGARVGMTLGRGAVVSTGYGSAALVQITPSWTMVRVNQFTTVSISSLSQSKGSINTSLRLQMGTVRAVVKSSAQLRSRFRISTPVATASVRGTIPEVSHFPGQGTIIRYLQGSGFVISRRGRMQLLSRGQSSRTGRGGHSSTPFQEAALRAASGSILSQLTPGELALLSEGFHGGLPALGPQGGRRILNQFRRRLQIILGGAYDPRPL